MRFHLRFPEDDWVDRPDLEAQQCVEATGTNTPINTLRHTNHGCEHRETTRRAHMLRVHCAVTDTTHQPGLHRDGQHNCITLTLISRTCPKGVSVVDGGGETPGPIPNPEAKPARADGTAPGREWESRLPPTQQLHTQAPATQTPLVCAAGVFVCAHSPRPGRMCRVPALRTNGCTPTSSVTGRESALRTTTPAPIIGAHP